MDGTTPLILMDIKIGNNSVMGVITHKISRYFDPGIKLYFYRTLYVWHSNFPIILYYVMDAYLRNLVNFNLNSLVYICITSRYLFFPMWRRCRNPPLKDQGWEICGTQGLCIVNLLVSPIPKLHSSLITSLGFLC